MNISTRVWWWVTYGLAAGCLWASAVATVAAAAFSDAAHTPKTPRSGEAVQITVQAPASLKEVKLWYQILEPGAYLELKDAAFKTQWQAQNMESAPLNGGRAQFKTELPAALQAHRRLVRYRFTAQGPGGETLKYPDGAEEIPNFAYFVYDGLPAWLAAISPGGWNPALGKVVTYDSNVLQRVQSYWLIAKAVSIQNATWKENAMDHEYRYTGTMVVDGEVYDHVGLRARGGSWRYAMGKNMWKFDFPKGKRLAARDDYGQPYPVTWGKLSLFACIDQADFGCRGEQGLFDAVGFRLFNLAGVPASMTHWLQLRIVTGAEETPANQYKGDYWGLYLAMENPDGRFLKAHHLPDGNLYKMENGAGKLSHQGQGAVTNSSDLFSFMRTYESSAPSEAWWRKHLNLPAYYSYRSICEAIHHYDIGGGKNYYYFHHPVTGQWLVIPWDIDLTWANHMFGDGGEPFRHRVSMRPDFRAEYQNRLREIRDLLYNPEETGRLIDEYAAIIADPAGGPSPVDADRAKWDYHPIMKRAMKGGQGLFYQGADEKSFAGMVRLMKDYVASRSAWIDARLLKGQAIPATPQIAYAGPSGYPAGGLRFTVSEYRGAAAFAAAQCRLAEVAPPRLRQGRPSAPGKYEITPVWESGVLDRPPAEFSVPAPATSAGHTYRARVRFQDASGAWSHWSAPVEFAAGPAAK
jgi:hypothetical protein